MPIDSIDVDIDRLRELCRPGTLPCAWHTAYLRVFVRSLARDDQELADGTIVDYPDEVIRAEFHRLLAADPSLPVCQCHAGEKSSALLSTPGEVFGVQ